MPYDPGTDPTGRLPRVGRNPCGQGQVLLCRPHPRFGPHHPGHRRIARIVFSGDVGRWDIPVLKDPEPPTGADLLLIESTYGGRIHKEDVDPDTGIEEAINTVAGRDGVLVIPAFSIGQDPGDPLPDPGTGGRGQRSRSCRCSSTAPWRSTPPSSTSGITRSTTWRSRRWRVRGPVRLRPGSPGVLPHRRRVQGHQPAPGGDGRDLGIGHGDRRTGAPPSQAAPAVPGEPGGLRRVPGHGTLGRELVEVPTGSASTARTSKWSPRSSGWRRLSAHADQDELIRWVTQAQPAKIALVHGEDEGRRALWQRRSGPSSMPR